MDFVLPRLPARAAASAARRDTALPFVPGRR